MEQNDAEIRSLLSEAELKAERLVAVARMAVALGLLAFFLAIVGPARQDVPMLPLMSRQLILAVTTMSSYFFLGLVVFLLARRDRLRPWMIWVSATADVAFLLGNIVLGLNNSAFPGALTFVEPPVWLVPVVLAFSVLRVNPHVQAYTGILAIFGLGVAIWSSAGTFEDADTQRVARFLSGPANAVRLAMIALAAGVLVVAAARTRRLLLRSITETRARANLTRFLPARLAPQLADGGLDELRRGRREDMAILFVDIRGFTGLTEDMAPQDVSEFVTVFRRRISKAAGATGGMIDKFIGDAAMVVFRSGDFGGPEAAARACIDCALRIDKAVAEWSADRTTGGEAPVHIGIGAHWGTVFSGVVGDAERLEYSVFGDAANVASRLEALTKEHRVPIVLSRALLDRAGNPEPDRWAPIGETTLRGRSGVIELLTHRGI